jgi:hypothetical protein
MLMDIEKKKSDIWDEIIKEAQEQSVPLQENEMTVSMFSEKAKIGYRWSRERLETLVREGKLTKRYANLDGHRTAIYRPATSE